LGRGVGIGSCLLCIEAKSIAGRSSGRGGAGTRPSSPIQGSSGHRSPWSGSCKPRLESSSKCTCAGSSKYLHSYVDLRTGEDPSREAHSRGIRWSTAKRLTHVSSKGGGLPASRGHAQQGVGGGGYPWAGGDAREVGLVQHGVVASRQGGLSGLQPGQVLGLHGDAVHPIVRHYPGRPHGRRKPAVIPTPSSAVDFGRGQPGAG